MGTIAEALALLLQVTGMGMNMLANAQQISALIQKANAEGRATFTAEEWAQVTSIDSNARAALVAQITAALQK